MRIFFNSWRDTSNPLAGGSELAVDRVARELVEMGHDVTVAVPKPTDAHPYRVVDTGSFYSQYLRGPITVWRDGRDADVIVDVANGLNHVTPLWRWRVPVVCWVHHIAAEQWSEFYSPPVARTGSFLESRVLPKIYRRAAFVTVSDSTASSLVSCGVPRSAISIIHNGIDLPTPGAEVPKSAEPLFVTVARLVPHKRIDELVDMWDAVRPETGGHLVIIGDGPLRDELEARLPPGCELLGRVSDAERDEWLRRSWLFLQTSSREGWGISVMEAATHETPSVAFDAPGSRDAIVDGETGVLAADRAAFTRSWIRLARDTHERERMGVAALRRATTFSWPRAAREFEALFERLAPDG